MVYDIHKADELVFLWEYFSRYVCGKHFCRCALMLHHWQINHEDVASFLHRKVCFATSTSTLCSACSWLIMQTLVLLFCTSDNELSLDLTLSLS